MTMSLPRWTSGRGKVYFQPLAEHILTTSASLRWGTSFLNSMINMDLPKEQDGKSVNDESSLSADIGHFNNRDIFKQHGGSRKTGGADGANGANGFDRVSGIDDKS
jgi:hypothetical protein